MTKSEFRKVLQELIAPDSGQLKDGDARDSHENWSSLVDVQIFAIISSDLGIEPDEEIMNYQNVGELLTILESRKAFK